MNRRLHATVLLMLSLCAVPVAAEEQTASRPTQIVKAANPKLPSRVFIDLNGGYRIGTLTFAESRTEPYFAETASWSADYELKGAPVFDVSGGGRVWRNLSVGLSFSQYRETNAASIVGSLPNPFFFNQNRSISGDSEALKHQEQTLNVSAIWTVPLARSLEVAVFGGPSFIAVKRSFVKDIAVDDAYPFETASFNHAIVEEVKENALGVHAGADVAWMFSQHVGLGATVRFTRASVQFATPAGGTTSIDLGGLETIAGLRIRLGGRHVSKQRPEPEAFPRRVEPEHGKAPSTPPETPASTDEPSTPAQRPAGSHSEAIVNMDSPVFVVPDSNRVPLRILAGGTRVRVLEESGAWLKIEFQDVRWGRRVGYVLAGSCSLVKPR